MLLLTSGTAQPLALPAPTQPLALPATTFNFGTVAPFQQNPVNFGWGNQAALPAPQILQLPGPETPQQQLPIISTPDDDVTMEDDEPFTPNTQASLERLMSEDDGSDCL